MGLYNCQKCGVVENTALGFYWVADFDDWPEEYRGKKLCSECGPSKFSDGTPTEWGRWHGKFPKSFETVSSNA